MLGGTGLMKSYLNSSVEVKGLVNLEIYIL